MNGLTMISYFKGKLLWGIIQHISTIWITFFLQTARNIFATKYDSFYSFGIYICIELLFIQIFLFNRKTIPFHTFCKVKKIYTILYIYILNLYTSLIAMIHILCQFLSDFSG